MIYLLLYMSIERQIQKLSDQPLTRQLITSLVNDYRNINDKIFGLTQAGWLEPIRRGLYVAGPAAEGPRPEPALLANHIVGPSYVTADTALSFYGLIPERVYATISATNRPGTTYRTTAGVFIYRHLPLPYYAFGVTSQSLTDTQRVLIANPQKAVLDKIVCTPGLIVRSEKQARALLFDNFRMEQDSLRNFDWTEAMTWLQDAPKSDSLKYVINAITN